MRSRALHCLFLLLLCSTPCRAQAPSLTALWPFAGVRGAAFEAGLEGANLGEATLWIGGEGVTATILSGDAGSLRVRFEISPTASVGPTELRVITPKGASNPLTMWVDVLPGVPEQEPNDRQGAEMPLASLPIAVDGRFGAQADVDCFNFQARAGDVIVVEALANRVYSAADVLLELQDSAGRPLAHAMEGYTRDPRIIHTIPRDGAYRVMARDALYRGGTAFVYRLAIGKLPLVTCAEPSGGMRGESLTTRLAGVNLGGRDTASLPIPADAPFNRPLWQAVETPTGWSRPFAIVADDNPQALRDPNQPLTVLSGLPMTVSSRFDAPREEHRYSLPLQDTRPVTLRGISQALGASAALLLRVMDPEGNEIANTEEQAGRDPVLRIQPPRAGTYHLVVRNVSAQKRPDACYRVVIEPDGVPGFRLTATPDVIAVQRGQTVGIAIQLERTGGFAGPVAVRVEGLSSGTSANGILIGPANTSSVLTVSAGAEAPNGVQSIRIVGEADSLARPAEILANYPRPGEGQPAPRLVEYQAVAVVDGVPLFSLSVEQHELTVAPGAAVTLRVRARRKPDDNAARPAIALEVRNLPPGISVQSVTIAEGQEEAQLTLTAAADAPLGSQSVTIQGKLGENVQLAPSVVLHVRK